MRKIIKSSMVLMLSAILLSGCSQPETAEKQNQNVPYSNETLIIYYSLSGNTKTVAENIQKATGGDIYQLDINDDYPDDMYETSERAKEERDSGKYPELKGTLPDLTDYKTIYIGGPVWSHTLASPLITYLNDNDFTDKDIIPFWTDAGDPGDYENAFASYLKTGNLKQGIGFSNVSSLNEDEMYQLVHQLTGYSSMTEIKNEITITAGNTTIKAELNDTKAAQELKQLLPLTLSMTRMEEHEYYSSLGTDLSEEDKKQTGYEIGDLAYWTPGDLFAIYFDEPDSEPEGLIILGKITDDIEKIKQLGNPQEITIALS